MFGNQRSLTKGDSELFRIERLIGSTRRHLMTSPFVVIDYRLQGFLGYSAGARFILYVFLCKSPDTQDLIKATSRCASLFLFQGPLPPTPWAETGLLSFTVHTAYNSARSSFTRNASGGRQKCSACVPYP